MGEGNCVGLTVYWLLAGGEELVEFETGAQLWFGEEVDQVALQLAVHAADHHRRRRRTQLLPKWWQVVSDFSIAFAL
jgi:hypothetical protein